MSRVSYICGWETGSLLSEPTLIPSTTISSPDVGPVSVGSVSLERTIVRTGLGSLKASPASGAAGTWNPKPTGNISITAIKYFRFFVRITALPVSTRMLWGDNAEYELRINSTGTLTLFQNGTVPGICGTSSSALTDSTKWYLVELALKGGTSGVATWELKIDAVSQFSGILDSGTLLTTQKIYFGSQDTVAAIYTAYFDDFSIDDAAYPGNGKVVLLVPISDNARSTEWTGGVGGTTDLWKAVSNLPPTGTASETNTTQIEHAGGATGSYDANITSYASAGLTVSDTINAVVPFVWTGEDSATGDKLLSFLILSNPTSISTNNFNVADGVSGALGTWPTGWWDVTGPLVSSPTVIINTSPVMRITRPETATRVASCCFMGIYVDYSSPTTSPPSSKSDFIPAKSSQIVSVNRASFY